MTIDLATEENLRKVLFGALKSNHNSFEQTLEAFADKDSLLDACARATDLSALMILEQCKGRPSTDVMSEIAEHAAEHNQWSSISSDQFHQYISAIFAAATLEQVLELGTALRIPFVLCAHLLLIWHAPAEQAQDYLDRLWDTLEADRATQVIRGWCLVRGVDRSGRALPERWSSPLEPVEQAATVMIHRLNRS
jgi:hypothetical protein